MPSVVPLERQASAKLTAADLFPLGATGSRTVDLLVVGDTGVDFFVRVPQTPGRDGKAIGAHLGIYGGGMAANFATAAHAAAPELSVGLVSRLGSDEWGRRCLRDLQQSGLDVSAVAVQPGGTTWWCAVALDDSGEKALLGGRTSASLPRASDLDQVDLAAARWLHLLGDLPFAGEAIATAGAAGTLASVDIEASFVASEPERAASLIAAADLAILNREALYLLSPGSSVLEAAVELLATGHRTGRPKALLVTAGESGSLLLLSDGAGGWSGATHAAATTTVVDSTGAGDAFAGTFVGLLLRSAPFIDCLEIATSAATRALLKVGARGVRLDETDGNHPSIDMSKGER
jgi:ribokinase